MWQISRTRGLHISANCLRKTPTQQCIALVVGRRRYRVVDWDRCVTLEWFRRIAHLHRSAIARLLSEHIWSSHLLFGRPGGCVQERSGRRPKEMSIWQWRAWCAGVSFQSLATWPNRLLRLLIIRSISDDSHTLSYLCVTDTVIPSNLENMLVTFYVERFQVLGVRSK